MPAIVPIKNKRRNGAVEVNGRKGRLLQRQAYQEVKRLIVTGKAPPGSFLSERQLALRLGMSKTPVHVALERLEAEGFVDVSPQQGIVVRGMSVQDVVEHYELRQALDSFIVSRLAGKLTPEQTKRLQESLSQQTRCVKAGDIERHVELDTEFHLLLCRFLNNQQITQVMEQQRERIHQVVLRVTGTDRQRMSESLAEHAAIVDAIVDGDAKRASRLAIEHLEAGKRRILNPRRL